MPGNVYKVIQDWDTVIWLKRPITEFAVWEKVDAQSLNTKRAGSDLDQDQDEGTPTVVDAGPDCSAGAKKADVSVIEDEIELEDNASISDPASAVSTPTSSKAGHSADDDLVSTRQVASRDRPMLAPTGSVYYLVSSHQLKMTSLIFAKLLGDEFDRPGHLPIVIDDCDEQAMLVLLNILHLRNRQVPRKVDLDMLAKLAVLIDRYGCHEETEVFTGMWTAELEVSSPPPSTYGRELILWLCIACVFRLDNIFFDVTATAVELGTDGSLRTLGLPIPSTVTKSIDRERCEAIRDLTDHLHHWVARFRDPNYECPSRPEFSLQCGAILLGALIKEMDSAGFYTPTFNDPFDGFSVHRIWDSIRHFQKVCWFDPHDKQRPHRCNLIRRLNLKEEPVRSSYGIKLAECDDAGSAPVSSCYY